MFLDECCSRSHAPDGLPPSSENSILPDRRAGPCSDLRTESSSPWSSKNGLRSRLSYPFSGRFSWECSCPGWSRWLLTFSSAAPAHRSHFRSFRFVLRWGFLGRGLGFLGSDLVFIMITAAIFETNSRVALISGALFVIVLTAAYFLLKKQRDKRTMNA